MTELAAAFMSHASVVGRSLVSAVDQVLPSAHHQQQRDRAERQESSRLASSSSLSNQLAGMLGHLEGTRRAEPEQQRAQRLIAEALNSCSVAFQSRISKLLLLRARVHAQASLVDLETLLAALQRFEKAACSRWGLKPDGGLRNAIAVRLMRAEPRSGRPACLPACRDLDLMALLPAGDMPGIPRAAA